MSYTNFKCKNFYFFIYKSFVVYFTDKRLLPYGQDAHDTELTLLSDITSERASALITIPNGLPLFGGIVCSSAYVSGISIRNCSEMIILPILH